MLTSVDRILVAVNNLDEAEKNYSTFLGAERVEDFESDYLQAKVRKMAIGVSEVELCQPTGAGITQTRLDERGEGLLFGGVNTPDLEKMSAHLKAKQVEFQHQDGRLYINPEGFYGLPLVISAVPATPRQRKGGPVEFLYELTSVLKSPWDQVAQCYADVLGIDRKNEVEITFPRFGYEGALLKFAADTLDRIELSEAHDTQYPMGRYTNRYGDSLYMCYIQTDDLHAIKSKLKEHNCRWTRRTHDPVERNGLWIHPSVLNGVLLGVSRTSLAWEWSGQPERVQPLAKK